MSHDESDDLAYNPFSEQYDDASGFIDTQGYFNSTFFPRLSQTTLRRRRSSLVDRAPLKDSEDLKKHLRSRTEIHIVPHSAGLHPLKSALAVANGAVFQDVGITRPHLSRIVNEGTLIDVPSAEVGVAASITIPPPLDEEKEVIVHHVCPSSFLQLVLTMSQVTSKDSLAGVSLKYGISLPELRKANRLWASDSIHRRELLYIPVDKASRAHEYIPEPSLMSFAPDEHGNVGSVFTSALASVSPISRESSISVPPSPSVPIRRIPTKQLSYFPPSTNKALESDLNGSSQSNTLYRQPPSNSCGPSRYPSSSANSSLTSILTALPIAASTRDEIITRLSFDNVSSSFSDRSHTNSDEETGHELGEVATHKRRRRQEHENGADEVELSLPTPTASQPQSQLPSHKQHKATPSSSLSKPPHIRSHSSTSPPRFYLSHANETYVRTSQMEPSPAMQLPVFQHSTVGRPAGKRGRATGEIVRTGSLTLGRKRPNITEDGDLGFVLDSFKIDGPS